MCQTYNIMARILLLIITFVLGFQHLSASTSHYSYTQLSLAEGLSQASVQAILLDSKGNLWIGTRNGLNLYAQQKMSNYFHSSEDRFSLPDNQIVHIAEDSIGNIWVATSQGLTMYNPERNSFDT